MSGRTGRGAGGAGRIGAVLVRVAGAVLVVLSLVGVAMAFPDLVARHVVPHFLYLPGSVPAGASSPAAAGLEGGRELRIETEDGISLHAWWIPPAAAADPRGGGGCGAVLFFHGNAGTLVQRAFIAEELSRRGFGALLVDYRGYGLSEGDPDEEGLYRDGRAALRHLVEELGMPPGRVAVAGHSLGSAVAAEVAAGAPVGAVLLTGVFRTLPELAQHAYPYLPDPLFRGWSTHRFEVHRRVSRIDAPLMVARGGLDTLVPRGQSRAVYEAAPGRRRWYEAPAAGHNDVWDHQGFWREATPFLSDALGCDDAG